MLRWLFAEPMGKITALKVQKRNPNRVNVYLDDEFAFGLARIVAAWLHIGQELSVDKIALLQAQDAGEVAYLQALHFISFRPRSEVEVHRKLAEKGASPRSSNQHWRDCVLPNLWVMSSSPGSGSIIAAPFDHAAIGCCIMNCIKKG